jgi:hypothetical protein
VIVSELNARYYEQVYRGNVFFASHQAAGTFSANAITSTSAVGLIVYNPPSSIKNLVPTQVEISMTSYVTTSTAVNLAAVVSPYSAVAPTVGGALSVYSAKGAISTGGSVATAQTSCTFATAPVVWKQLFSAIVTTTIASAIPTTNDAQYDFGGSLIIPPGQGVAIVANNASTGWVSLTWLEIPV